ncbi:hypothetical protein [Fibrobacter sp. UWB11]|uniref:hypothetical protein n=1 Tax=Fibrobacter sp. UWB11 TaxID=1896202 RepID=UPI0009265BEC|nr:hypothetical protein [Fibrobacter sp. UWB11]SIO27532.1 hypothetical protein SAMN05720758_1905 [Fibrobacter sp. UWB11]
MKLAKFRKKTLHRTARGRGPSSEFFTHPGASANLTAQQWGCKQPRCVRLLRLWPTLPFSQQQSTFPLNKPINSLSRNDKKEKPFHKTGKATGNPWHRVQFDWREKIFFRLSTLCVFLKALNQEGGENAVHCFDSLFLTAPMITKFY